jgi:hypothetical protein
MDDVELARLGIRRVEGNAYHRGEYIYGNLRGAIAAVARARLISRPLNH